MAQKIILIIHNVRSCHNVGSMFRTVDGLGVDKVYLSGYTPYPRRKEDERPPHIAGKVEKQIDKTALGAQDNVAWEQSDIVLPIIQSLKSAGVSVVALEQSSHSIDINAFKPPKKCALIVGNEVDGLDREIIDICDSAIEIPMQGQKESFNVSVAAAIALYQIKYKLV